MTISSTTNKAQHAGSGTTGPFAFAYKTFAEGDLDVIKTSSLGVDTTLTITTQYTVSLNADQNNDPGGDVTLLVALAVGETLTILRTVDATQETDIANGGGFYPEVIENSLDRLTMLCQQNAEVISRAVVAGATEDPQAFIQSIYDSEANAAASASAADASADAAAISAASADASAGSIASIDGLIFCDGAGNISARVIGTDVQAYDADTAKLDVEQTWTQVQRTNENIVTSLTLDLDAAYLDFRCTPAAGGALTFSNIPASPLVQKGTITFVNGSNYAITAHANTKVGSTLLATISATGTYMLSYRTGNGVCYITSSGALA